jgi:monoamine oxidase
MNRRDFLIKTGLTGASTIIAKNLQSTPFKGSSKVKSVIVIGAGLAGLASSLKLVNAGIKVTILESRDRVGGRVYSFSPKSSKSQVIELGAEWVGNSHERVIKLCEQFGLQLVNNQFETDLIVEGKYHRKDKWSLSPEFENFRKNKTEIWNTLSEEDKRKLDKTDWWRYLSKKGFSENDLNLRDLIDSTDFGESIRHTSAYAAFAEYAESSEKNEMDLKIKGGNGLLPSKMADAVGRENILLNHKVIEINQNGNHMVKVTCEGGKTLEADRIICTTPTYSLMKINWNPILPKETIEALNELQYSRIGKFPMVFSEKFWKRDDFDMVTDTPAHYFYHGTKNQESNKGVLMCYAIGDKADALGSVSAAQRKNIILNALLPAFGNVSKYLVEDLKYYWGKDQYSFGAYAFYGKGQWFEVMPILKQNFRNVFFAGEHLADWQGFMEGAINSGEDAAQAIILN